MVIFILGGVFLLGITIFIHELGHYLFGRLVGVQAEIFSIGFGRGIWRRKIGPTTWQVTAIPLGGYVKFYGDDFAATEKVPGGFFSVPPLIRIIPVLGGPFFNLILAFVIYLLVHSLYGPISARVQIWEESANVSPAYRSGLRNGDVIRSIDGNAVSDFYDLKQRIALSGGNEMAVTVLRGSKELQFRMKPDVDSSGIAYAGLRPAGKRYLEVGYPIDELWRYRFMTIFGKAPLPPVLKALPYLRDGDVILSVNGVEPHSVVELQQILGKTKGDSVTIAVKRQTMAWLSPWFTEEMTLNVPFRAEYVVNLTDIIDEKYGERIFDQKFYSSLQVHQRGLAYMELNGDPAGSFEKIYENFPEGSKVTLSLNGKKYEATIAPERIGFLGFRPRDLFEREYLPVTASFSEIFGKALSDTWGAIMLYPQFFKKLFTGRMSFVDNARGPVAMFAMAGMVFKSGLQEYLQLMAAISIALMVMNLLPFPVVDGGHVVVFLYEAIAGKPIPTVVLEGIYRFGFTVLMILGLWIMYRDIIFFIGM